MRTTLFLFFLLLSTGAHAQTRGFPTQEDLSTIMNRNSEELGRILETNRIIAKDQYIYTGIAPGSSNVTTNVFTGGTAPAAPSNGPDYGAAVDQMFRANRIDYEFKKAETTRQNEINHSNFMNGFGK